MSALNREDLKDYSRAQIVEGQISEEVTPEKHNLVNDKLIESALNVLDDRAIGADFAAPLETDPPKFVAPYELFLYFLRKSDKATQAEVLAGLNNSKFITPKGLTAALVGNYGLRDYDDSGVTTYAEGVGAFYGSSLYRCNNPAGTSGAWNADDWDVISAGNRINGIVSGCDISVETFVGVGTNKRVRVTNGTWYISPSEYTKATDTVSSEITLCVTGGDFKYYDVVADNTGAITIYEGTPSTSPAHYVIDPLTEVLLGFIIVGDAVIEEPAIIVDSLTKKLDDLDAVTGAFTLNCDSKDFPSFFFRLNGTAATLNFSNYWNVVEGTLYIDVNATTILNLPNRSYESGNVITSKTLDGGGSIIYRVTFGYLYGEYFWDFGIAGGRSFDPAVDTVGNITPTNSDVVDDDTITIAIGKLQGQLDNVTGSTYAANTILGNNTGSASIPIALTTDQFTAMMEIAVSVGTAGIITSLTSATYKYIRLTGCTGLGGIVTPSSYKDIYIWNDTNSTITLYHDYSGTSANDRILCGANRSWANNTMLHLKYSTDENKWCTVSQDGNTFRALLAGTGTRLVAATSTGQEEAIIQTLDIDFSGAQQTSATTASWTGVNEVNIAGLLQGQLYIDVSGGYRYECHRNDYCSRTPVINVEVFTTNSLYPIFEVTGTSATLAEDSAYVINNASLVTMSLPSTGTLGKVIIVNGKGAGGWKIAVPNAQQIVGGLTNTLTNGSGYIQAGQYASVTLKCITGGTAAVWEIVCINPATTLTIA